MSPDCVELVGGYLQPRLSLPVSHRVPSPRPAEFVRVTQVPSAGFTGRALFVARVVVEVWAPTARRALEIARTGEAHLSAATFYAVCQGPGHYPPDPDTGTPKAGFTADIYVRGTTS